VSLSALLSSSITPSFFTSNLKSFLSQILSAVDMRHRVGLFSRISGLAGVSFVSVFSSFRYYYFLSFFSFSGFCTNCTFHFHFSSVQNSYSLLIYLLNKTGSLLASFSMQMTHHIIVVYHFSYSMDDPHSFEQHDTCESEK